MALKLTIVAVIAIPLLVWAFLADLRTWRRKSDEDLAKMASGSDWRPWKPSLDELKRREKDIKPYRSHIVASLAAKTPHEREAARLTLVKLYPDMSQELEKFKAVDKSTQSAEIAKAVIRKYGP